MSGWAPTGYGCPWPSSEARAGAADAPAKAGNRPRWRVELTCLVDACLGVSDRRPSRAHRVRHVAANRPKVPWWPVSNGSLGACRCGQVQFPVRPGRCLKRRRSVLAGRRLAHHLNGRPHRGTRQVKALDEWGAGDQKAGDAAVGIDHQRSAVLRVDGEVGGDRGREARVTVAARADTLKFDAALAAEVESHLLRLALPPASRCAERRVEGKRPKSGTPLVLLLHAPYNEEGKVSPT